MSATSIVQLLDSAALSWVAELGRNSMSKVVRKSLLPVSIRLQNSQRMSAAHLSRSLPNLEINVASAIRSYFGCLSDEHAISLPRCPLGFSPTESQLTTAIAHVLKADESVDISKRRTQRFLQALLKGACYQDAYASAIEAIDKAVSLNIESEKTVSKGRRIDLLIDWELPGGAGFAVAIEAKFEHKVTSGQLPAYRQEVCNRAKNGHWALILLTVTGESNRRNKDWTALTWRTLLTRWECLLEPDERIQHHFTLLRKLLWDKL